jgi:hypothetical protein
MKTHPKLAAAAGLLAASFLTSCYVVVPGTPGAPGFPPIGDPPGNGGPGGAGKVLEYSVSTIDVYQLPEKKSKKVYWDSPGAWISEFDRRYPDVYFEGTSNGRVLFKTPTVTDHNPSSHTTVQVPRTNERLDSTPVIHFGFFDRDSKSHDEMGGYKVKVPTPAPGSLNASKMVQYRNSNGEVHFKVNFTYRWVNP